MSNDLKPCPFCGGKASMRLYYSGRFGVECDECRVRGRVFDDDSDAAEMWNTRAGQTCRNEVVEINKLTPVEFRTDNFRCSHCSETFYADNEGINHPIDFAHCPSCGAKVVNGNE